MADDVRLKLFLEASKEALRQVQEDVQRSLKSVKMTLEPEIAAKIEAGDILGLAPGKLQSELSKIRDRQVKAGNKVVQLEEDYSKKLAKLFQSTEDSTKALKKVSALDKKYKKAIVDAAIEFSNLSGAVSGLGRALELSREAHLLSATRLGRLKPGALEAALKLVSDAATSAARTFHIESKKIEPLRTIEQKPLPKHLASQQGFADRLRERALANLVAKSADEAALRAMEQANKELAESIDAAANKFRRLGFNAEDMAKFLELGKKIIEENIGQHNLSEVSRGLAIRSKEIIKEIEEGFAIPLTKTPGIPQIISDFEAQARRQLAIIKERVFSDRPINPTQTLPGGFELAREGLLGEDVRNQGLIKGRDFANQRVFVLQDAVRAQDALARVLREEARAIIKSIRVRGIANDSEREVASAQLRLAKSLRETAAQAKKGWGLLGNSVIPLNERVTDLILHFGSVPEELSKFKNSLGIGAKNMLEGLADARSLLKQFGTNFKKLAEAVLPEPEKGYQDEIDENNKRRAQLVKLLTDAYKRELKSSEAINSENNVLLAERKRLKKALDEEIKIFRREIAETIKKFDGVAIGLVGLGSTASTFTTDFERVKKNFIKSLDANKVAFFKSAGQGEILSAAIGKLAQNFKKQFFGELDKVQKEQVKEQERIARIDKKIADARGEVLKRQQEFLAAIQRSIIDESTSRGNRGSGGVLSQVKQLFVKQRDETVKAELKAFSDLQKVGSKLDATGQERLIKALRGEAVSLKELNVLLKQHQGNLAKSSAMVDRMTASMRAGEKAAFQFGFAVANAAERLTAWASPATLMFETISLLREATSNIIRMDTELRKLIFFSPELVAAEVASLRGLDATVQKRIATDTRYAEALASSGGSTEQLEAKNRALAKSFSLLIERSRDTGLSLEDISSGLLATARVGQRAFEINAQTGKVMTSTFFEAVEAFKRLEGAAANTDTVVSLLNSTLNEFELSAENAISVTAAVADAAGKSALEGQELFDVLVRTGGAFNLLTGASVAESLAVIQRATEANIPSVSKLATAIRQFTTLAIENADAIERFSGIKLIEAGQIKDMETFVSVLEKLNKLAPAARNEFLSLFSERDTGATILALATRARELRGDLIELADANLAAARASAQTRKFLEQQLFQQEDLNSSINRLKASIALLIKDSGAIDFIKSLITGLTGASDTIGGVAKFIQDTVGLFKLLGFAAAPVILNIIKGFRQGFIQRQNAYKVEQEILSLLNRELGATEAVNKAVVEGLISQQQAEQIRARNLKIATVIAKIKAREEIIQAEINALRRTEGVESEKIAAKEQKLAALEQRRANILKQELALRKQTESTVESTIAKSKAALSGWSKHVAISLVSFGAIEILPGIVGNLTSRIASSKKVGEEINNALQSAILGAVAGSSLSPVVGTALGALVGGLGAIINSRREAARTAEEQARIQIQADRAANLELKNHNARQELRRKTAEDISIAEKAVQNTMAEIERLEIEINRVGAERADREGLLVQRTELQQKLIQQQLQLRQREKAALEETVRFEERRANIRERQLTIEKTLGLLRQAEVGLAKSFGNTKLAAELEFQFDTAQVQSEKRALEQDLSEVVSRLAALRADLTGGKGQEIRALEKERVRIERELIRNQIDLEQVKLANAERISDVIRNSAEEQINSWAAASSQVVNAFRQVISAQADIVKIIERQGDVINNIIEQETRLLERLVDSPRNQQNANQRERELIRLQGQAINRQIENVERILSNQRLELDSQTASDIEKRSREFREALSSANEGLGQFAPIIELSQQKVFKALENQIAVIEANAELAKNNIQIELDFTNRIIELRRKEIENLSRALDLQRKKNEQDADFGRKLLQTPDEFLKEIKNIATAQRFFSGIQPGDVRGIEERIRSLQENSRAGGFVVLRQVLEGLQAAVNRGLVLQEGFSPERLLEVFSRLQFQSASDIQESTTEEQRILSEIENLHNSIIEKFDRQLELLEDEARVQSQLQENSKLQGDIAKAQSEQLMKFVEQAIKDADQARKDMRGFQETISRELRGSLEKLNLLNKVTAGEAQIRDAIKSLEAVMSEIRDSDPNVSNRRRELKELGQLMLDTEKRRRKVRELAERSWSDSPAAITDINVAKETLQSVIARESSLEKMIEKLTNEIPELEGERESFSNSALKVFRNYINPIMSPIAKGNIVASSLMNPAALPGIIAGYLATSQIGPALEYMASVQSPVSGKDVSPEMALQETRDQIARLESLLEKARLDRENIEKQIDELDIIEAQTKRMADLQAKLGFYFSSDNARMEEARRLATGKVDVSRLYAPTIPTETPAPADTLPASEFEIKLGVAVSNAMATWQAEIDALFKKTIDSFGDASKELLDAAAEHSRIIREGQRERPAPMPIIEGRPTRERAAPILEDQQRKSQLQIPDSEIEKFKKGLDSVFDNLISKVESTRIKVDIPGINVQLDARIQQQLRGEEFAQQLAAALQGTGLEDKVSEIQGVVAKLVKAALDRGETFSGVDMVGFGGGQLT